MPSARTSAYPSAFGTRCPPSGFYDGVALAAMLAALAPASEQTDPDASRWTLFLVRTEVVSVVVGLGLGAIGGLVIARSRIRGRMSGTWAQLATLAVALVCFQVGEDCTAAASSRRSPADSPSRSWPSAPTSRRRCRCPTPQANFWS